MTAERPWGGSEPAVAEELLVEQNEAPNGAQAVVDTELGDEAASLPATTNEGPKSPRDYAAFGALFRDSGWWRWGESNPRPEPLAERGLQA